jgi:hypothetical protein
MNKCTVSPLLWAVWQMGIKQAVLAFSFQDGQMGIKKVQKATENK